MLFVVSIFYSSSYDNEYDKKKKSFKFTDSEINHGSKDNDGVEYYVQHVSLEDKNYVVITTMYKTISSIDFETIENNEAKKKEQQDNYTKSREDSNSEESQRFLNTGQLILKQNDIKFKGKGIFLCVCALLVSIAIMSLLEVFVMFFDDDLRNSIAKSQHWENGSEKRNISKKSSTIQSTTTTTMFRSTLPPVSTTTISAVRTSTTLPLVQPTTSRAPAITSTAQSGTSNLVNGTSNNSSQ